MNKRKFLKVMGGGFIVAATPGCNLIQPTPQQALLPWVNAGTAYSEPRRKALSYAVLCPNPHNRQPWLVDLSVDNELSLYVDTERLLPHTDPYARQITIGLGCFTELMVLAAAADGWDVAIEEFPEGADSKQLLDDRPVLRARFSRSAAVAIDPLFDQVRTRQTTKTPFDTTRTVPTSAIDETIGATLHQSRVAGSNEPTMVAKLRKLTHEALAIEIDTPRTYKESVDLFRIGKAEIDESPDGIDFSGRRFELLSMFGLFSRNGALDRESSGFKQGRDAVLESTDTAMAHIWVITQTNTRLDQLNAGRDWMRIHLAATATGVALHPLSQALQEYSEMSSHYAQVHQLLAVEGGTIQMLARMGYAELEGQSPRWPIEAKIIGNVS